MNKTTYKFWCYLICTAIIVIPCAVVYIDTKYPECVEPPSGTPPNYITYPDFNPDDDDLFYVYKDGLNLVQYGSMTYIKESPGAVIDSYEPSHTLNEWGEWIIAERPVTNNKNLGGCHFIYKENDVYICQVGSLKSIFTSDYSSRLAACHEIEKEGTEYYCILGGSKTKIVFPKVN